MRALVFASAFTAPSARAACLVIAAVSAFAAVASAQPSKEQCIDANTQAQSALRAHKLGEARALLQSCLDPACPALVRADCSRRLDIVERVQPTIIFDAKDDAGNDVSAVTVSIDGHPLADRLDGAELSVDPGPHEFVFQASGAEPIKQSYVLKEFEKARRELVVVPVRLPPPAATPRQPPARDAAVPLASPVANNAPLPAPRASVERASAERPVPSTFYLLSGIAAAGLVDFAIAGSLGNHSKNHLDRCSPFCNQNKVNTMRREYLIGDIGLTVGITALVGAAVVFFARPSLQVGKAEARRRASGEWLAAALPGSGFIAWRTSF